ncbi:MAG: tyrosine-type recombinase/integrase [bacterium]
MLLKDKKISNLKLADTAAIVEGGKAHGEYGPQRAACVWRNFLKFLKDNGVKLPFDYRDIEIPKMPQLPVEYLTLDEINLLRDSIKTDDLASLRTRALMEVLLDTGMRIGEAITLNKKDIDWEKKEAVIKNIKSKEKEKVYFTDRSLSWIKKYLKRRKDNLEALFVSGRGRLLSVTARGFLRTHTKNLGLKKHICHHIFRKSFATHLIRNGANLKDTQYLCRHKSERTTLRVYVGIEKENAKKTHQKILTKIF